MKQWHTLNVIEQVPGKVSGVWVFKGTRIPVSALFENLRDGATIDEFLAWFPGVKREQVEAVNSMLPGGYAEIEVNQPPQ